MSDGYICRKYKYAKPDRSYDNNNKKIGSVSLTDEGKVKHFYNFKILDYFAKLLRKIFGKRIYRTAKVMTGKWKEDYQITKSYNLTQIVSDTGSNFKALYIMIGCG
jgi:hypothetical protein